jgi:hypothetical protein
VNKNPRKTADFGHKTALFRVNPSRKRGGFEQRGASGPVAKLARR